ncbi:hypothetical protein DL96DRAFT_1820313 [Flagelloscypha sp. PMI_526]|nr:hypothetical protein DL96DRAFT_1820313 [Flagelloscypha sp. PMI_526]
MPSNSLPGATPLDGEDPVWTLIKSYEETCRSLHKLRAQILSLQAQETVLEAKRISVYSILALVSRPARDMVFATSDIMERIFAYAVRPTAEDEREDAFYSPTVRGSDVYPVVLAIAGVCSLWRATTIHTPSLWQRISFSGWEKAARTDLSCASFRLRAWLRRSFPLPLTVDWNDEDFSILSDDGSHSSDNSHHSNWSGSCTTSLFESLAAHSTRWQAARLRIPFPEYSSSFPLALPNLKHLHLSNTGEGSIPILGSMPLLRNLALSGWEVSEEAFPWQQLTSFRIFNDVGIPRRAIQACHSLQRLYIDMVGNVAPFDIDQVTNFSSLCHLDLRFPLELVPLAFLNLSALNSMTVSFSGDDLPQGQVSVEFFERCSNLSILQIAFDEIDSPTDTLFTSIFCSSTVRILKLKLTPLMGLDSRTISGVLKCLTISHLTEKFSALEEVHIDVISAREDAHALAIESVAFTALRLVSPDVQQPSLRSVCLHIPETLIEPLSHVLGSSSRLHVSSTPLDFDDRGINYFIDGDLLLSDE